MNDMSTSPEAKQAAARIIDYVAQFADVHKFRKEHEAYIAGEIDAATAKLSEEMKLAEAARNFWENRAVAAEQPIRDFDKLSPRCRQAISELIATVELFSSMFKRNERKTKDGINK